MYIGYKSHYVLSYKLFHKEQIVNVCFIQRTNQLNPTLYDNVTSSLKRMHSLKRFAVFNKSLKYPLTRSLLLGALCNTSTTEVYISDRSLGKCTHKGWSGQHYIPFML